MKGRREFQDALAFADTDALRALEAITRQRPEVVVLERLFAASTRGVALINRIKADPALGHCEVRIVTGETELAPTPPVTAPMPEAPAALPEPSLDPAGTRWAPRFEIIDGVELLIDGNPATLVDLSTSGAQVLSPTSLR